MARGPARFGPLALDEIACRLLAPEAGTLEAPVRSVLFGAARFSEHGRSLAQAQEIAGPGDRRRTFFPRLQDNLRTLRDARRLLESHARMGHHLAPAAGWLIDHGALLERQFETVRTGLPRRYYEKLPRLADEPLAGLPRIYGLAWAWVAHTDSGLDEDLLELFLSAYQSQRELTLAELWAIPTTLRVVLIENLRRLAERAATLQSARDAAHRWVERTPEPGDAQRLDEMGRALARRGVLEAFALQVQRRSDELTTAGAPLVRGWLATHLPDPAGALQRQQQQQAEDHQSVRNALTALRGLDRVDWRGVLLRSSAALAELQQLPVFAAESEATQDLTLHDIEALARRAALPESHVSAAVALLAGRQGPTGPTLAPREAAPQHWLRGDGRDELMRVLQLPDRWARLARAARRAAPSAYLSTLTGATAALIAALLLRDANPALPVWAMVVTAVLMAWPASEAVLAVLHRLLSESVPPHYLPRLAFEAGIPQSQRPLVVMPVILTGVASVQALAAQLEQHHLANPERHAQFALLSDFGDGPQRQMPTDKALLLAAREAVEQLNRRYPAAPGAPLRFVLLHRERVWSDSEQCWMGWERKRGKLEQLLGWLAEGGASPFADLGPLSQPAAGVRSVVTLDADTDMPPGRLRELVAIHSHPLNTPRVDAATRRLTDGYAILQPRVAAPLPRAGSVTAFHWLFSGQWGVDPYSVASSEVYQDLFREGTYTGKGLLDVQAVHTLLAGRLPAEQVLSHDLLEGSLARCAAVSDVTLVEDSPAHPDVAASRLHRWTRGDWQLLPFILHPQRWPLAGINRWKMFDNLRRSLVAPCSLALLVWVLASGALPLASALWLVAAAYGAGPLLGALAALAPPRDDIALGLFFRRAGAEIVRALAGAAWHLLQLLAQALLSLDAAGRALVRQFATRRRLLQWTTAAAAQAAARTDLPSLWLRHRGVTLSAGALFGALLLLRAWRPAGIALPPLDAAIALCALWATAPLLTWAASLRMPTVTQQLDEAGRARVRTLARETWAYYVQYVGAADHHLPPDNVQFTGPQPMVAHRTSPTNIGLYLLVVATAREMGFIDAAAMVQRLEKTIGSLDRLPRWRGHFYNWTDTQTLATLPPAYVSAVDSGNLSASLLVLSTACETLAAQPVPPSGTAAAAGTDLTLDGPEELRPRLLRLAAHARTLALAADFGALYDRRRRLMHIGCEVESGRLDASHYDLLASEARLASLVAIAKGDIPATNWAALGRPVFAAPGVAMHAVGGAVGGAVRHAAGRAAGDAVRGWVAGIVGNLTSLGNADVGLRSWSGSMFEYLMPSLIVEEPAGSLLHAATRTAVAVQRQDAAARGQPWGVSESAIAVQDHTLAYQYGPQGVATLALRRTPSDERVIAPYASALALMVEPQAAVDNFRLLTQLGARRELGFIEALDYTPYRQPANAADGTSAAASHTPVLTFMAHHQAMTLLACAHVLTDGVVHRWSAQQPHLRAVQSLLHERVPHLAPLMRERPPAPLPTPLQGHRWQFESQPRRTALPVTHLLGNDRYAVALRANGAGCSQWQGLSLTRWRDDVLADAHGIFGYVMRAGGGGWQSLASHPASEKGGGRQNNPAHAADYRAEFHPDRALLHARWSDLQVTTTVSVSTMDDCELRRVQLRHSGRRPLRLVLAMAFEPTLAPQRADEAHPAFSNLFLQSRWSAGERAMFMQRRPRLGHEKTLYAVHGLAACDDPLARVRVVADRARWLGRLGTPGHPLADAWDRAAGIDEAAAVEVDLDTGLDPVSVLMVELTLPPRGSRELTFVLGAAWEEDPLRALLDRHQQPLSVQRTQGLSDTLARIRLRELRLDLESWVAWLHLNTLLLNAVTRPALGRDGGSGEAVDRRLLWRHAIGGDRPILAVWIESGEGVDLARHLVSMLPLWTAAGLAIDLVLVNAEPASYAAPVQQAYVALGEQAALLVDPSLPAERRSALKLLNARDLPPAEQATLRHLSRVWLYADGRSLAQQIERMRAVHEEDRTVRRHGRRLPVTWVRPVPEIAAPTGRFDPEDAAFRFTLTPQRHPLRPWVNVLANPEFGCQVSEAGAGYTWAGNSRMHQVTAFANDALCDPPAEALWLHDLDRHRVWWLGRGVAAEREVVHGIGWTRMQQVVDGLAVELEWSVDAAACVKQLRVRIAQPDGAAAPPRRLRLVGYAEWTLGAGRGDRATVVTRPYRWLAPGGRRGAVPAASAAPEQAVGLALLATQRDASGGRGGATAFLCWRPGEDEPPGGVTRADVAPAAWIELDDWTSDRREFFDGAGRRALPVQLHGRAGAGLDACGAVACRLDVAASRPAQATLLLGHADSADAAARLALDACAVTPAARLAAQTAVWRDLLGGVQVATPDPLFDALVNRWLPYQAVACRIWARAGFYQAGGAFGFRDQLQDAMNLADRAPQLLQQQIRVHAARQFEQGDVQHWWHPPGGAGVRTRMTDDLLWLPLALAHSVARSGDAAGAALLDERVPFLHAAPVPADKEDVYETPAVSEESASLFEHGARAIDRALQFGAHGLPLMGTGDWNDGMNRVGFEGRGESVWLAWFLCRVIDDYVPLAERRAASAADHARVQRWREARDGVAVAIDAHAWDGAWYRRAYFDDGSPLGSAANAECRIDLIAQAWAVLSGAGDPRRAAQAMDSARRMLYDPDMKLMRLLDPPLEHAVPSAGYIQAYPRGIRENGGQYNHGAVWALMAFAQQGDATWAWRMFEALSPAHRSADPVLGPVYALEPYVMAGDIYSQAPWGGRGGWSWYTGAASWLQRAAIESICGLRVEGRMLTLAPCLPLHWPEAGLTLQHDGRIHRIAIVRDAARLRELQAAQSPAVAVQAGEPVDLAQLAEGSVLALLLGAGAGPRPADVAAAAIAAAASESPPGPPGAAVAPAPALAPAGTIVPTPPRP